MGRWVGLLATGVWVLGAAPAHAATPKRGRAPSALAPQPLQLRSLSLMRSVRVRANDSFFTSRLNGAAALKGASAASALMNADLLGMPLLLGEGSSVTGLLMEEQRAAELRQQYNDMNREYEAREKFGLLDPWEKAGHEQQMRGFSESIFNSIRDRQIGAHAKRVERNIQQGAKNERKDSGKRVVATGVVVVGAVAAMVAGHPLDIKLAPEIGIVSRLDVLNKHESLRFYSPLLQSELSFSAGAPDRQDMAQGMGAQGERFKLYVGHQLPLWSLTAGVIAGSSSRTVQATLTKQITPEISMVWGSTGAWERPDWNQQTFTLQYGVSF